MKTLPKISIVVITLNNQRTIEKCLQCIVSQNYPKNLVELLNVDGGSTDLTKKILKRYGFKVIESKIKRNAEAQRAIAIRKAKNNLIVSIDADNYLSTKQWIKQMVKPFIDDPEIIHAGTMHFKYSEKDSLYNRYCGLFGVVDPIVYYIGKPDRLPQNTKKWTKGTIISENDEYYTVKFTKESLPTVGCNGVVYRRDFLLKYAKSSPSEFLHIDVFVDLIEKGYDKFAIVKNDIIHDTAVSLTTLMKKRLAFLTNYYLNTNIKRRYFIYNPRKIKDTVKLLLFIIYTVTIVKPLIDSVRGYSKIHDLAWFVHPFACWVYSYSYFLATIKQVSYKNSLYEKIKKI